MAGCPSGQPALFISMAYIVSFPLGCLVNKIYSNYAFNTWVFVVQVRGVQMGMI